MAARKKFKANPQRAGLRNRVMQAVSDIGGWVSYAEIARWITPISDSHGRNVPYNQTVFAIKELVRMRKLVYRRRPLAGHPAEVGLNPNKVFTLEPEDGDSSGRTQHDPGNYAAACN